MRSPLLALFVCVNVMLVGCSSKSITEAADLVFQGGAVFTSDPENPTASAVAIRGDRIVYVGNESGVASFIGDNTRQITIGDGLLISGFMDSHTHVFNGSFSDVGVNLSLADTREKLQSVCRYLDYPYALGLCGKSEVIRKINVQAHRKGTTLNRTLINAGLS